MLNDVAYALKSKSDTYNMSLTLFELVATKCQYNITIFR